MINIEIALVLFAKGHIPYVLLFNSLGLDRFGLPTKLLNNDYSCMDTAAYLLKDITNIEAVRHNIGWLQLKQGYIFDNPKRTRLTNNDKLVRIITIPYTSYVNTCVPLLHTTCVWKPVTELDSIAINEDHADIIKSCLLGNQC